MTARTTSLLAIDLATVRVGYAHRAADGALRCGSMAVAGEGLVARWHTLGAVFGALLDGQVAAWPRPDLVAVETPSLMSEAMRSNPATLKALYGALGVVHECCRRAAVELREVDPRDVREWIVGRRTASKEEIQHALLLRGFTLPTRRGKVDHDAVDALALAVCVADGMRVAARTGVTR